MWSKIFSLALTFLFFRLPLNNKCLVVGAEVGPYNFLFKGSLFRIEIFQIKMIKKGFLIFMILPSIYDFQHAVKLRIFFVLKHELTLIYYRIFVLVKWWTIGLWMDQRTNQLMCMWIYMGLDSRILEQVKTLAFIPFWWTILKHSWFPPMVLGTYEALTSLDVWLLNNVKYGKKYLSLNTFLFAEILATCFQEYLYGFF